MQRPARAAPDPCGPPRLVDHNQLARPLIVILSSLAGVSEASDLTCLTCQIPIIVSLPGCPCSRDQIEFFSDSFIAGNGAWIIAISISGRFLSAELVTGNSHQCCASSHCQTYHCTLRPSRPFSCPPSFPIVKQRFNVDIWYPKPCSARR